MIGEADIDAPDPRKELTLARSIHTKMERLMENEDFKYLHTVMQEKLDVMVVPVFAAPSGVDGELANIFRRGEVAGFKDAMSFAVTLKQGMKETIAKYDYLDKEEDKEL